MVEGIERDIDIVTQASGEEMVQDAMTNVDFNQVAYADGGTGLNPAIATGGNTLIIADGGSGIIAGNVTVRANQTLQGGASAIPVRGLRSGTVVDFTAPGSKPTVQSGGNNDVIFVGGDNVHVAGLTIDGLGQTSDDGFDIGSDKTNIVVDQNMFVDIGEDGFDADFGNSNVRIFNNMFAGIGDDGIDIEEFNTNFTIIGNTISVDGQAVDADGIELVFLNSDITISGNTIIVGAGNDEADGIDIFGGNSNIRISNNTIMVGAGNFRFGVNLTIDNVGVTISGNTVTIADGHADADGILLNTGNNSIAIADNTISIGTGDEGFSIHLLDSNTDVTITGNVIATASDNGNAISVTVDNGIPGASTIVITDNTLSASGLNGDGLYVGQFNVIEFSDNIFTGSVTDAVVDFDFAPNIVNGARNTILPGTVFTNICGGAGNFTGTLEIIDNSTGTPNTVTIVNGGAPCI